MTKEESLIRAGKIIADPSRWCQNACAVDKTGKEVEPCSARSVRWSGYGVIYHVYRLKVTEFNGSAAKFNTVASLTALLDLCASRRFRKGLTTVNDQLGHAATLQLFRDAVRHIRANPETKRESA